MKFRKKPVVVEAYQNVSDELTKETPAWLVKALLSGVVVIDGGKTFINTKEGRMEASEGDWIIQGVQGELYPCKPDIFAAMYEPA